MSGFFSARVVPNMMAILPKSLTRRSFLSEKNNGDVVVRVYVVPNASMTQVTGIHVDANGQSIRLKLQAPPVNGKANAAVRKWLANYVGVPQGRVELVRGSTSQHKQLKVTGTSAADWQSLVASLVQTRI